VFYLDVLHKIEFDDHDLCCWKYTTKKAYELVSSGDIEYFASVKKVRGVLKPSTIP